MQNQRSSLSPPLSSAPQSQVTSSYQHQVNVGLSAVSSQPHPANQHSQHTPMSSLQSQLASGQQDILNNITTETEFLLQISKLSMEKLLERLTKHELTKDLPIDSLKKKLEEFKEFLCKIALHCLCDDVVILNDNATQSLENKCTDLQLPHDEVIGAFLNCENSWTSTSMKAQLSFPKKSIQDLYASLFIYGKVKSTDASADLAKFEKNMRDLISSSNLPDHMRQRLIELILKELEKYEDDLSARSDKINVLESILSEAFEVDLKSLNLNRFQNVFSMLIGILYHFEYGIDEKLAKDLVDLLKKSGITNREQFVQVLNSVKCNDSFVRLIAKIPGILDGTIEIRSGNTFAYASLFKIAKPESVTIDIHDDPSVVPRLEELIFTISNHHSQVKHLKLQYLFRHPEVSFEKTSLGNNIKQMMKQCPVKEYMGSMNEISFSHSLKLLYVSVTTQEEIKTLNSFIIQSHALHDLNVCVSADVDHRNFIPILEPKFCYPSLYIVDVTDENMMNSVNIIKSLQPLNGDKKFYRIFFPRCNRNINPFDLMESMGRMKGIRCISLQFPSSLQPQQQQQEQLVQEEANRILGCQNVYWGGGNNWSIDDW